MKLQPTREQRVRVAEFQRKHRIGLLTLLFTDTVGSTRLKQTLGDLAAIDLVHRHHALIRELLAQFREAEEIETAGDSFFIVFAKPSDATRFSLRAQARLNRMAEQSGHRLADRIGIHLGEVIIEEHADRTKDLYGIQVDTCARVMSLAEGGQILMTRAVFDNARQVLKSQDVEDVNALSWVNHGAYLLKGIEELVEICEVGEVGSAPLRAPADSEKAHRHVSADSEPVLGWRPALAQTVPGTAWVLKEKLGEGGFGEVWLGQHQTLREQRVFKFCFRADRVRPLKREVTLFRLLKERIGSHPNIVGIQEVNFNGPPYYLVMDYSGGKDLRSWGEAEGGLDRVPLPVRLEIVAQAAAALAAAHAAGVLHRDVKPSNLLIAPGGADGQAPQVKLTDFGIGQVVSAEVLAGMTRLGFTQTLVSPGSSSHTGTMLYMAPELVAGRAASVQSDLYALGVVLYQLVVGDLSRPITTDWAREIRDPDLREDLEKCLAGNPAERFRSAGELAERLRSLEKRQQERAAREAVEVARENAATKRAWLKTGVVASFIVTAFLVLTLSQYYEYQAGRGWSITPVPWTERFMTVLLTFPLATLAGLCAGASLGRVRLGWLGSIGGVMLGVVTGLGGLAIVGYWNSHSSPLPAVFLTMAFFGVAGWGMAGSAGRRRGLLLGAVLGALVFLAARWLDKHGAITFAVMLLLIVVTGLVVLVFGFLGIVGHRLGRRFGRTGRVGLEWPGAILGAMYGLIVGACLSNSSASVTGFVLVVSSFAVMTALPFYVLLWRASALTPGVPPGRLATSLKATVESTRRRIVRCLIATGVFVVPSVCLFYAIEDWRGKRAWEHCQGQLAAQGVVTDWKKLIPPRVPDGQNFFKAPKMTEWFVKRGASAGHFGSLSPPRASTEIVVVTVEPPSARADSDTNAADVSLRYSGFGKKARLFYLSPAANQQLAALFREVLGPIADSPIGFALLGTPRDRLQPARIVLHADAKLGGADIVQLIHQCWPGYEWVTLRAEPSGSNRFRLLVDAVSAADYLAWSDKLEPDFELIRQALKRPYARMDGDYSFAAGRPVPNYVAFRVVDQLLATAAECHLLLKQRDRALREMTLVNGLRGVLEAVPANQSISFVTAMVDVALGGLYEGTVADGLRRHAWHEPELVALQRQLAGINLVGSVSAGFQAELAGTCQVLEAIPFVPIANPQSPGSMLLDLVVPRGWIYQNMVHAAVLGREPLKAFDLVQGTLAPRVIDQATRRNVHDVLTHASPYNCLLRRMAIPNFFLVAVTLARNQTMIHEAEIACALERYRLAHGEYPETIEALRPLFIDRLPHDLIGGQPLHYHRTGEGKFLLYSVGWNEKDDGGREARTRKGWIDDSQGDWVWKS